MLTLHDVPVGWSPYGYTHALGMTKTQLGIDMPSAFEMLELTMQYGFSGLEIPFAPFLANFDRAKLEELRQMATESGLFLHVATGGYTLDRLRKPLEAAAELGAKAVRTTIGGAKIGGDRRPLSGRWHEFVAAVAATLAEVMPVAEDLGVSLGIENHQDVSSEDLEYLLERVDSPKLGLTLDTGNPLATAEHPIRWVEKLAPHIVDIHLKDYRIFISESGFRLARCPLGQGSVPVAEMVAHVRRARPDTKAVVEHGAVEARHIRVFADDYWPDYPRRSARQFAEVMGFVMEHREPDNSEWRTPVERGLTDQDVVAWEEAEFRASIEWLRR